MVVARRGRSQWSRPASWFRSSEGAILRAVPELARTRIPPGARMATRRTPEERLRALGGLGGDGGGGTGAATRLALSGRDGRPGRGDRLGRLGPRGPRRGGGALRTRLSLRPAERMAPPWDAHRLPRARRPQAVGRRS